MASEADCETAFAELARRLSASDQDIRQRASLERSLSCRIRDLGIIFGGRLHDGELIDVARVASADAQIRMTLTSDDLLALVAGQLNLPSAWASGRVKIEASVLDLLKLRSWF